MIKETNVYCSRSLRPAHRAVSIVAPGGTTKEGMTTDHPLCGRYHAACSIYTGTFKPHNNPLR